MCRAAGAEYAPWFKTGPVEMTDLSLPARRTGRVGPGSVDLGHPGEETIEEVLDDVLTFLGDVGRSV